MLWVYSDGGRELAGFRGEAGDCATRSIAIAGRLDYRDVYRELADRMAATGKSRSARNGVSTAVMRAYLADLGWEWTPTMSIGSGCQVHLRGGELPDGRLVVRCSRHFTAVVDSTIYDTHDPSRDGNRCVYGYWTVPL